MAQSSAQSFLGNVENYLNLKPLQKRVVWLSLAGMQLGENLPGGGVVDTSFIIGCCFDASGMNAAECMQAISALTDTR